MVPTFELRRRSDDQIYTFVAKGAANGCVAFKRVDADLWITFDQTWGWCARIPKTGDLAGIVWGVPVALQGAAPPPGTWVSRKNEKSYVYDLIWIKGPHVEQAA